MIQTQDLLQQSIIKTKFSEAIEELRLHGDRATYEQAKQITDAIYSSDDVKLNLNKIHEFVLNYDPLKTQIFLFG